MPQTCEKCQQIFYSETEFRQHQFEEKAIDYWDKAIQGNLAFGKALENACSWISTTLHNTLIYRISKDDGISIEEAAEKYLKNSEIIGRIFKAFYEKKGKAEGEAK